MTKKFIFLAIIIWAVSLFPLFADNQQANLWMQMNTANSLALNLDLTQTISLPANGTSWGSTGYDNNNYLAKVGAFGISDPVYLTITSSKLDSDGNFILGADSHNNLLYRKFKIGLSYRKANNNNGHGPYYPTGSSYGGSFFSIGQNGDVPYPLPITDRSNNISYAWLDLLIILDDPSAEEEHLGSSNDYTTLLTINIHTADNRFSQTMTIPLLGYYDSAPNEIAGECFFNVTDYSKIINLKTDFADHSTQITVGHINFASNTLNKNSNKKFSVYVSPDSNYLSTQNFYMKRISTTSNTLTDMNSVPIKIILDGDDMSVSNSGITLEDLQTETSGYVNATAVSQDSNGFVEAVTGERDTLNYIYNANVNISLADGYDMGKLERLISGEYYCDVYFIVKIDD